MNRIKTKANIKIPTGGMYQEWMCLMDLVGKKTANKLNELATEYGCHQVHPNVALGMGFGELVDWSKPETDVLVMVGDDYLVCLKKNDFAANIN